MKDLTKLKTDTDFQGKLKEFSKTHFRRENEKIIKKYYLAISNNSKFPDKNDFNNVWTELKRTFFEKQNGRCCICEKELNDIYSQDIEHYRPKSHYWWLAYNPVNYYLSCAECNRSYKKEKFPLSEDFTLKHGQAKIYFVNRKEISEEQPLLLNPLIDNQINFFQIVFVPFQNTNIIKLIPKDNIDSELKERAKKTIEIYNLDLHSFTTETDYSRFELLEKFYNDLFEIAKARMTMNDKDHFKQFLLQKLNERKELQTLDLIKLIVKKQVIINTLSN
jgi:uncharacterized protein (TIGR02646 family)